ncbi:MAG: thiamine phosphate synthase [Oscillospiraceae bacterium]|nr:thiamine phosphate synthase [Oscillospiraceae bacterium]
MNVVDLSLYLVTNSDGRGEDEFLGIIAKACEGGVTLVQLREKDKTGREYVDIAHKVKAITDCFSVPLIIDDRLDVAMAVGAAGVHLGQQDIPVAAARRIMGAGRVIGASAKTVKQAIDAESAGADYLGVGAIFPTTTKVVTAITPVGTLDDIAKAVKIPVVAIGGLNAGNIGTLFGSGANGVAVITAIMDSQDPKVAAAELRQAVMNNFMKR